MSSKPNKPFELFPRNLGVYPYVWLIYVILPVINLQSQIGVKLGLGYALIGLFLVTYRQLYSVTGVSYTYWLVAELLVIMALTIFYDPNNLYLSFFSAVFIGWYADPVKFRKMMLLFASSLLLSVLAVLRSYELKELVILVPFLMIMLISPFGIRSMVRRQSLEKELDVANDRIKELVKRDERMRIARDLHDTLGHTLSLITLKSQLVEKLVDKDPARARTEAVEIGQTSRAALRQVRELVADMRALKVTEAIAETQEILQAADIAFEVKGDGRLPEVSDLTQNILSMCIKEAATNIVKHSKARHCRMEISKLPTGIGLTIEDDGSGFPANPDNNAAGETPAGRQTAAGAAVMQPPRGAGKGGGNGIPGMAERLSLINGTLALSSSLDNESTREAGRKGRGARLTITVPLVEMEQGEGTNG